MVCGRAALALISLSYIYLLIPESYADGTTIFVPGRLNGTQIGLLILPGAEIGADAYIPIGGKIQDTSDYSLYLATVGKWIGNLINPVQLPGLVKDAVDTMRACGLNAKAPIYIAGHSLAGVFLDMYVRSKDSLVSGLILYGSYINKSIKLDDYPVPVLTMSGDLDGLCRLTRVAKDFSQLKAYEPRTPVVIVPGANHSQIASGKMPSNVERNDLIADNTEEQTHQILAAVTNAFMTLNGPLKNETARKQADQLLQDHYYDTKDLLSGYLNVISLDTATHPFVLLAVQSFAGMPDDNKYQLNITGTSTVPLKFGSAVPTLNQVGNNTIIASIPVYNAMPWNPLDISLEQQSPKNQWIKTPDQAAFKEAIPGARYVNHTGSCHDVNLGELTFAKLVNRYKNYHYLYRYMSKGTQLQFLPDRVYNDFLLWREAELNWDFSTPGIAKVSAPIYRERNVIFAKIIPISTMTEWIMIDAFKKR